MEHGSPFIPIWTLLLVAIFVGIIAWAFGRRRKQSSFDEASQDLPLEDDKPEVA